jgi:nucleotide-binding universal stress UspA family protein
MKIETILVPVDFSDDSRQAIESAKVLAKQFAARVVILHAYHLDIAVSTPMGGGYPIPQNFYDDLRTHAIAEVDKIVAGLTDDGVKATGTVNPESAAIAIIDEAERLPADLIVMGTRGLTGIKHAFLGSIAERIVRTAPCPVLTVKADD